MPSPTASGGIVKISRATLAHIWNYAETLTVTVDGQTTTVNFSVIILDPCETDVFQTSTAPLPNTTINIITATTI